MRAVGDGASSSSSVPDASCGPLDDLWGSRALAHTTRDAATPLENESHLLRCLIKKVGPFADAECLRQHLRAARGKLHWSANGYFREAVTATVTPPRVGRARRDFEPKPLARDPLRDRELRDAGGPSFRGSEKKEKDAPSPPTPSLPPLAWERVLSRVSLADACRLARVAPATREAAGSESVWRAQYAARWGARAVASLETRAALRFRVRGAETRLNSLSVFSADDVEVVDGASRDIVRTSERTSRRDDRERSGVVSEGGSHARDVVRDGRAPDAASTTEKESHSVNTPKKSPAIRWRDEYRARHARDANMTCPECLTSKVTPIVYGFPSPALVAAMRDGLVLLGGDYLVEGDPNWACKACQSRWRAWPFSWPDDALAPADERRRMRVSSRPGAAGAGHGGGGGRGGGGEDDGFAFGDLDVAAPVETSPSSRVAFRSGENRASFVATEESA